MVNVRRLIDDATNKFERGSFMSSIDALTTARDAVAGDYYLLLDSLSDLIYNVATGKEQKATESAKQVNEISRRLLGSDCVPMNGGKVSYNDVKACMVKLRDWANQNIDFEGICVYDKRAPKSLINMCKLTSRKIMAFGRRAIEDASVFAGVSGVYVIRQGYPDAWVTSDDSRRVIIDKPAFKDSVTKYEAYAKDVGVNARCSGVNDNKYIACRVDNETQASALMTMTYLSNIKEDLDELDDYVYDLLIEREEEHVKHNIEIAKKYEKIV